MPEMSAEGNDNVAASVSPDASAFDHEAPVQRRTWLGTIGAGAILTLVCAACLKFFIPGNARVPGSYSPCRSHLSILGKALRNYHSIHGSYPPVYIADASGRPIHSWRAMLLPHLVDTAVWKQYRFDESWDGPQNRKLNGWIGSCFRCPYDESPEDQTSYVAVVGPGTMWPGSPPCTANEVTDGISKTIALVEVRNSGINWCEPRDLTAAELKARLLAKRRREHPRNHDSGGHVLMADASVHWISDDNLLKYLDALISIDGHDSIGDLLDSR